MVRISWDDCTDRKAWHASRPEKKGAVHSFVLLLYLNNLLVFGIFMI